MRFKHKKLIISGTAVATAGALGVGALLQTVTSVQASSDMMPGIEQIVNENTEDAPFRILELVNNSEDAEIGYYISGQEPSLKLYEYQYTDSSGQTQTIHFTSVQDALSKLPAEQRAQFMQQADGSSGGIKDVQNTFGDDGPLSYSAYQEKYFLDSGDTGWTKVDLKDFDGNARTDTVNINGSYQENSSGTGNYTKADQKYYPIRKGVSSDDEQTEKYRENIQSFYPSENSESRGAYYLEFAEVENSKVNEELARDKGQTALLPEYDYTNGRYGYYTNVYKELTKAIVENIDQAKDGQAEYQFPGENPTGFSANDWLLIQNNADEAVKSTSIESNAFSSGESADVQTEDTDISAQDAFMENSNDDTGSVDFDNGFQSGEENSFDSSDSDSVESDISLEQQSYEQPVDSSDVDAFSDDFSDQPLDSEDSSEDTEMQIQEETDSADPFEEETRDSDPVDEAGDGSEQLTESSTVELDNPGTAGTQENPYLYFAENIDAFPYSKYEKIGDLEYVERVAAATAAAIQADPNYSLQDGDILLDQDQYWYYKNDSDGTLQKYSISIVTGREPVAFNELQQISDDLDYNYYYRVEKVYFCCEPVDNQTENPAACVYRGWYYPSYPENGDIYIPVTDGDVKVSTHYGSEASYSLTPGIGTYDFVPGGDDSCQVEVSSLYYQGGYSNHDWFKKYVFHLTPKESEDAMDGDFENFDIEVDTKSADDATKFVYAKAVTGSDTAAQSVAADESIDSESVSGTMQDESDEVDFTSEFQDTEIQDAGDSEEAAMIAGDEADAAVQDESAEAEDTEQEADASDENIDSEVDEQAEDSTAEDVSVLADVGDGVTTNETTLSDTLKEYDLIYLNGEPAKEVAEAIAEAGVPCIINAGKVEDSSVFKEAFSALLNTTDADKHYVNRNIYFFKNNFDTDNTTQLINKNFDTNFNEHTESDRDLVYAGSDPMSGFEEVIKYINSENRYRKVQAAADGEDTAEGDAQTQSTSLLSKEISQARAIEYIINYQYKRTIVTKDKVNVLEIMPDKNGNRLTEDEILSWINAEERIEYITPCCEDKEIDKNDGNRTFVAANLRDGDPNTFWHTQWQKDTAGRYHTADDPPYIDIVFKEPEALNGFTYQARPYTSNDGHVNGVLDEYTVELYDKNNKLVKTENGKTNIVEGTNQNEVKTLEFENTVYNVKRMKLIFTKSWATKEHKGDSVFGSCAELGIVYADNFEDEKLSVNIDVMTASEFVGHIDDLGAEYDMIYFDDYVKESERNRYITGNSPMLYTHVGGAVSVAADLRSGNNFFTRFLGQLDKEYLLNDSGERYKDEQGRYYFAPVSTYSETGAGYFRGSGNDLTDQKREELVNFVKSGYPVILGTNLVKGSGADRTVDSSKVDTSSYYYQFFKEALEYTNNVITKKELTDKTKDITFFANLTKPQINFTEKPLDVPRAEESSSGDGVGWIANNELKYVFSITNDSDLAPLTSTYDCKLYLDLNLDGNMSEQEAQDDYITIMDSNGNVLTPQEGRYQLKLKESYTLTRKIPSDYYKLITWKLVVSNNNNTYIHTSSQGYAKQKNTGDKQKIKVLQIKPDSGGTWNLKENTTFQNYLKAVEDFDIEIEDMKVSNFEDLEENAGTELDKYQVLILGFDDVYQDISNDHGQVDAIKDYIKSGRSVIFAHDTTSYLNYNYTEKPNGNADIYPMIAESEYGKDENYKVYYDGWMDGTKGNSSWGISFNNVLRSIVGMDRYGITSDAQVAKDGKTISQLLKEGNELSSSQVDFATLRKYAGDIAYKSGDTNRSSSYAQTQALTNALLQKQSLGGSGDSERITKVNDGAITQYPYRMDNSMNPDSTWTVSKTGCQYYQLALEQDYDSAGRSDGESDIVVWYCLAGNSLYTNSPNDVRNYYYYYSKGNVIYCGSGHTDVGDNQNEAKLLVNSIVAAANVTAVEPEVSFVKSLNPVAEKEISRYYMTDQSSWTAGDANVLEKDMTYYINVRDYNMVSTDLSQENLGKKDMTVQFYIDDANGSTVEDCPATGKVTDITASIGTLTGYGNIGDIQVSDGKFHLTQNTAYGLRISDIENYLHSQSENNGYKESCRIYVKVTSTVSLYGKEYEGSSWASIELKQRQLFEMD